jgi:hypothetical protein
MHYSSGIKYVNQQKPNLLLQEKHSKDSDGFKKPEVKIDFQPRGDFKKRSRLPVDEMNNMIIDSTPDQLHEDRQKSTFLRKQFHNNTYNAMSMDDGITTPSLMKKVNSEAVVFGMNGHSEMSNHLNSHTLRHVESQVLDDDMNGDMVGDFDIGKR